MLFAAKLNGEMRRASVRSGHQLTDIALAAIGGDGLVEWSRTVAAKETPGCQPVATAVAYAAAGVGTAQAVASDLFAFAVSFLGAALRLQLADHRSVQVVLHAVGPVIARATEEAVERDLDDMGGFVPMADVMSAGHERAEARLFAS
jgi:urease accessory protein